MDLRPAIPEGLGWTTGVRSGPPRCSPAQRSAFSCSMALPKVVVTQGVTQVSHTRHMRPPTPSLLPTRASFSPGSWGTESRSCPFTWEGGPGAPGHCTDPAPSRASICHHQTLVLLTRYRRHLLPLVTVQTGACGLWLLIPHPQATHESKMQ